ncbi:MAG TPA: SDR family NAD(P)-dependent oxidoreductase [Solirubrobacteraceae bacterium]|nr:SDR family NAD(P)-dependent oxidoreductase [Solirubrobacteraceae bacterium]
MTSSTSLLDASPGTLVDLLDLSGQTALVTGAAGGIGAGIARRLHEAGASVVIADVDQEHAGALAAQLHARRAGARSIEADVSAPQDAERMVSFARESFGSLDILVNNAGIYPTARFMEMDQELFEHVLRVNLLGPFLVMQAAARQMIAQGHGGTIINVSSIDALHPSMIGLAAYDASKHGLWGLTKNAAMELAEHGIRVNALAPGAVITPGTSPGEMDPDLLHETMSRIPIGRMAVPDEMGRVAVFLASGLSSYLIGSQVVADGGLLLR